VPARLLIWNLSESETSLAELRHLLPRLEPPDAWISHEATERFGLISLSGRLPDLERLRDLIGKEPEVAEEFDVEQ
jgi:hypothetical protein